ncbi:MAG: hypothetical protein RIQ93_2494 [Verrucomicrobiota bacterium]|jgi:hypothetical protein
MAEFFALRFTLDLGEERHTAGGTYLIACLPWQDLNYGRQLMHVGIGVEKCRAKTVFDVDCGTLAEVLFLRLVRQGDAQELAGPHVRITDSPSGKRPMGF